MDSIEETRDLDSVFNDDVMMFDTMVEQTDYDDLVAESER